MPKPDVLTPNSVVDLTVLFKWNPYVICIYFYFAYTAKAYTVISLSFGFPTFFFMVSKAAFFILKVAAVFAGIGDPSSGFENLDALDSVLFNAGKFWYDC